ncbi:ABC transporter ATP-binding protein [Aureimonas sp. SA4125]|uniref:ABC transporter ATP-binding protein n=1 Tax=Aureimonas sp. SA4125 TaxID=2826993 RepID=UPI001CC3E65B|nr:ABC transporter ATP-binding protein [Aureimonas sp. SA4125]BDA84128.1 ABC transporter ATP-binding protein [Aureimonas sp. SA4125]
MTDISVRGVSKRFGATQALADISLDFASGSFTALLGASGCGKTTLLRLIAGFEAPDSGEIRFGGDVVADARRQVAPEHRGVGVVFQSYALWPHMNVGDNVAYPLKTRRVGREEVQARVEAVLATVGLSGFGTRRIEELSGGQRQRVALARCLVAESRIILFDEPLANLDMHLRASMTVAFREIHDRTGTTMVYVTHDQSEALALADRVVVMQAGRILQADEPANVYAAPADRTVAGFVGRGFLVPCAVSACRDGMALVSVAGHSFGARLAGGRAATLGPATVLLRPETMRIDTTGIAATVVGAIYRGPVFEVLLRTPSGETLAVDCILPPAIGDNVHVAVSDAYVVPD